MKPFLLSLAEYLYSNYSDEFHKCCVIFPNRRAGLYFQNHLGKITNKTIFAPEITTLSDFIQKHSDLLLCTPLRQLCILYGAFVSKTGVNESFDEFYYWGQVMLADFDEIDKEMADAEKLYSNIHDLKVIEARFGNLSEEQLKALETFWGTVITGSKTGAPKKFLTLWEKLYGVYKEFNSRLDALSICYEGKSYRRVAENFKVKVAPELQHEKYFIAGFNALSASERSIFASLRENCFTEFFWDFDKYYIDKTFHEAGTFIRQNIAEFPPPENFTFSFGTEGRNAIQIISSPANTGQAKILPAVFNRLNIKGNYEDTAVILADENLLVPVLYSLPGDVTHLNISMSYPVKHTSAFELVEALLEFQKNIRRGGGKHYFPVSDLRNLLSNFFIKKCKWVAGVKEITGNTSRSHIKSERVNDITDSPIFYVTETPSEYCIYLEKVLKEILENTAGPEKNIHNIIEKQVLYSVYREVISLKELADEYKIEFSGHDTFMRVFRQAIPGIRVSFRGEPLSGLQVMGLLETRLLDFKNIVILSVNEGVLPRASQSLSLIPYNLRKAFNMLTQDRQDSVSAYYFYRLLSRAENVAVLYSNASNLSEKSVPGRYIYQLLFDNNVQKQNFVVSDKAGINSLMPLSVQKDDDINSALEQFRIGKRTFSPSSLTAYMACPLKFYFRYIADIKPVQEVVEGIDYQLFGTILHKSAENLYSPYINKTISKTELGRIENYDNLMKCIGDAFAEIMEIDDPGELLTGQYLVNVRIINEYLKRIINYDKAVAPFTLLGFENEVKLNIKTTEPENNIAIKGFIDRLIQKDGITIIQDFKTGEAATECDSVETLFDDEEAGKFSAMRQVLIYCLAVDTKNVKPEILTVKKVLTPSNTTLKINGETVENVSTVKDSLMKNLSDLLSEILSPENNFNQTEDAGVCGNCDYIRICGR